MIHAVEVLSQNKEIKGQGNFFQLMNYFYSTYFRPKEPKQRNLFQRERSLQDIDKDIETIWKELQELDTPNTKEEREGRNYSR